MPKISRRNPNRRGGWSERIRERLSSGFDYDFLAPEEVPASDAELAAAWQDIGDDLTREHAAERPLSRPWGWWRFSAPQPRRRVEPGRPYTHYRRAAAYGVPANCDPDEFEIEADYLRRMGLLLPEEKALLQERG